MCVCLSPCLASIMLVWLVIVSVNCKRGPRVAQGCCTQSLHQGELEPPHLADTCFWQDVCYYVWIFLAKGFFGTTLENHWPYHWNGRYSLQVLKSIHLCLSVFLSTSLAGCNKITITQLKTTYYVIIILYLTLTIDNSQRKALFHVLHK